MVQDGARRPLVEFDFALLANERLVVGEAKKERRLDGNNDQERLQDARKLLRGAKILEADEVCLATAETWTTGTKDVVLQAKGQSEISVSMLEKIHHDASPQILAVLR